MTGLVPWQREKMEASGSELMEVVWIIISPKLMSFDISLTIQQTQVVFPIITFCPFWKTAKTISGSEHIRED